MHNKSYVFGLSTLNVVELLIFFTHFRAGVKSPPLNILISNQYKSHDGYYYYEYLLSFFFDLVEMVSTHTQTPQSGIEPCST